MSDLAATIVVPTFNEAGNVGPLLERLNVSLQAYGYRCAVLFVDDSPNLDTVAAIRRSERHLDLANIEVELIHREGTANWGGLAGAVIDGYRYVRSNDRSQRVIVMDADLQHPPKVIPSILQQLTNGHDLVVASRYCPGGSSGGLDGPIRHAVSVASTWFAKGLFPGRLRKASDPMTGCYGLNLEFIDLDRLNADGFKILLEILVTHPGLRMAEVPMQFNKREAGDSKGDLKQGVKYLQQLRRLRLAMWQESRLGRYFGTRRFVDFAVGGAGVAVVGAILLYAIVQAGVTPRAAFATQLGVTLGLNFAWNYFRTWKDRLRGEVSQQVGWFLATRGATQVLSFGLFQAMVSLTGVHAQLGLQVFNLVCLGVTVPINYITSDKIVFRQHKRWLRPRSVLRWGMSVGLVALGIYGITAFDVSATTFTASSLLLIAGFNTSVSSLEARWRMYGWRTPEMIEQMRWPEPASTGREFFAIIVPALNEADSIGHTIQTLLGQNYWHYQIIVSLCDHDEATIAEVRRVMREFDDDGRIYLVVKHYAKSSKPRQLNAAFAYLSEIGSPATVVGVIDAEDDTSGGLLERVDAMFQNTDADVVQGGVQLMNLGRKLKEWYNVHNVMEYFGWFSSRMFFQIACGFVPLGGNTVFIRREMLARADGWPLNLTEDCALGVLLCTKYGAKVVAAYDPAHATREEVPATIFNKKEGSLFWQRVRWNQGFLSIFLQGQWLKLPTLRQRVLAGYVLATPFLQAFSSLLLPLALVTIFALKVPVFIAMLMFLPFVPIVITMMTQVLGLREFSREYKQKAGLRHYIFLLAGAPLYQWVLMGAALVAVIRHIKGNTDWYKTARANAHRSVPQLATEAA